jgi:hypothetical protein
VITPATRLVDLHWIGTSSGGEALGNARATVDLAEAIVIVIVGSSTLGHAERGCRRDRASGHRAR